MSPAVRLLGLSIAVAVSGCGRFGFDGLTPGGGDDEGIARCGEVTPVYPGHAGWGEYVPRSDETRGDDHQADTPCAGFAGRCIHAGARRALSVPELTSCDDVTATDALAAFRWRCDQDQGGPVIYSDALAGGLADLVTATGWQLNAITLRQGGRAVCATAPAAWWDTPVVPLVPNEGTGVVELATPDTVHVVEASRTTSGYVITADGVSLVMKPGATLRYAAAAGPSCNSVDGTATVPDAHCVISVGGADFAWIEGRVDGGTAVAGLRGVSLISTRSSRLHRLHVRSTNSDGIRVGDSRDLELRDVDQEGAGGAGIFIERTHASRFVRIRVANNAVEGLRLSGTFGENSVRTSAFNVLSEIVAANNGGRAGVVFECGAHNNILSEALLAGNAGTGIYSVCNRGMVATHVTSVHNKGHGIHIDQSTNQRVSQVAVASNAGDGLRIDFGASDVYVAGALLTNNGASAVHLDSIRAQFSRFLVIGDNLSTCTVVGRSMPGLVDTTCTTTGVDGSSSYGADLSTAVLRTARTAATAFAGPVTVDDPASPFDVNGSAAIVTDWWAVVGRTRVWGRSAVGLTDPTGQGRCMTNCRLWDWSVVPGDALHDRSGDGEQPNAPFVDGQPCPAAVDGDAALPMPARRELPVESGGDGDTYCEAGEACYPLANYLISAVEILGDGRGDDDGLCNSNERCRYTPNIGAVQPGGAPMTCTFRDGVVAGVEMLGY